MDFELPLSGGDLAAPLDAAGVAQGVRLGDLAPLLRRHLPATTPCGGTPTALEQPALGDQPLRGYLTGSVDVVLRVDGDPGGRAARPAPATWWSTTRPTGSAHPTSRSPPTPTARRPSTQPWCHSDYPLQALLYAVVLHRFLRWRQPGYDPELHLGGVLYLYLRGMCGADTPLVDGEPCGVFRWTPAGAAARGGLGPAGRSPAMTTTPTTDATAAAGGIAMVEPLGPHDRRRARSASGLLAGFNDTGLLEAADVHVARRVAALAGEADEQVQLALALAVRGVRSGSTCVDLAAVPELLDSPSLPGWPEPGGWVEAVAGSPLVAEGVLHLEGGTVYLDRYHRLESQVCDDLVERVAAPAPAVDAAALEAARARIRGHRLSEQQERAAVGAVGRSTTVLTGGPGTGKTTTIARLLVLLADQAAARGERFSVALTAPTGKAATRLQEAVLAELADLDPADRERVGRPETMTLHRLLGWRPDNATRFRHDRGNRLKHDLVVVDESSMVELTMMGRLLEAVRPQARLVLVGDPRQLTSVGAGAVLADVVRGFADHFGEDAPESPVASLTENFRSTEHIKELAEALRAGDADEVLATLRRPSDEVELVELPAADASGEGPGAQALGHALGEALRERSLDLALRVRRHAVAGEHEAGRGRPRHPPPAVRPPRRALRRPLLEPAGRALARRGGRGAGAGGVVRRSPAAGDDQRLRARGLQRRDRGRGARARRPSARLDLRLRAAARLRPARLEAVETMHAMTVHKSQGSQAAHVTVLLPEADSRLLTRELFYTAITRAQEQVRVVASEAAVRAAVAREAQRASGLRHRLARRLTHRSAAADRA